MHIEAKISISFSVDHSNISTRPFAPSSARLGVVQTVMREELMLWLGVVVQCFGKWGGCRHNDSLTYMAIMTRAKV